MRDIQVVQSGLHCGLGNCVGVCTFCFIKKCEGLNDTLIGLIEHLAIARRLPSFLVEELPHS